MGDAKRRNAKAQLLTPAFELLEPGTTAYALVLAEARQKLKPEALEGMFYLFKLRHGKTIRLHGWGSPSLKRLEICVQAVVWSGTDHCETPTRTEAWYRSVEQSIVRYQVALRVKRDLASASVRG